mgnify:CR=1 FL=1
MLYPQSRQGSAKGSRSLIPLFIGVFAFLTSCGLGSHEPTEAELSAFGNYVTQLDSSVTGHWFDRMGLSSDADSALAYLQHALPEHGLDPEAFKVSQIAEDLKIVRSLAFDSIGQSINEVLPRLDKNLSQSYVRYVTGQRYGFVRPKKILDAHIFAYEVESPDTATINSKLDADDRLSYLVSSQPQGSVYKTLQKEFAKTTDKDQRRKVALNMERCRWQMKQPDGKDRYVVVNIAAQALWAVGGDSVLPMRICCGKVSTKTPLLYSEISYLQVNPEWNIPYNIVKSEVASHGGDSAYFARHRYYIVNRSTGEKVDARSVSPSQLTSGNWRVSQQGGAGNSLGRIVFRFPNDFSVYLHDTSNRGAFNSDHRLLSHGCVRVQKPFDLACFLLPEMDEWTKDMIRISMDLTPYTDRGRAYVRSHADDERPFRLISYKDIKPKVPLYITYYTVYPNPATGVVETWPDLYGYDQLIGRELEPFLQK